MPFKNIRSYKLVDLDFVQNHYKLKILFYESEIKKKIF